MAYQTIPPSSSGSADIDTVGTGLTLTTGTLTANLSTGVAGGQTIIGGTAASESLTLSSTANATKGTFIFGSTTGMVFNETTNVLSIGIATPATGVSTHFKKTSGAAGNNISYIQNATATGYQGLRFGAADGGATGILGGFNLYNASYGASGFYGPGLMELTVQNGSGNLRLGVIQDAGDIIFTTRAAETLRFTVTNLGNIVPGAAALATNATDGFTYIQTCAGTPTGVPTAYAGRVAMVFDTTNNKFYIYDGSWLGGTVPGAFV